MDIKDIAKVCYESLQSFEKEVLDKNKKIKGEL